MKPYDFVPPIWRPLLEEPCEECGSTRLRPLRGRMVGNPASGLETRPVSVSRWPDEGNRAHAGVTSPPGMRPDDPPDLVPDTAVELLVRCGDCRTSFTRRGVIPGIDGAAEMLDAGGRLIEPEKHRPTAMDVAAPPAEDMPSDDHWPSFVERFIWWRRHLRERFGVQRRTPDYPPPSDEG